MHSEYPYNVVQYYQRVCMLLLEQVATTRSMFMYYAQDAHGGIANTYYQLEYIHACCNGEEGWCKLQVAVISVLRARTLLQVVLLYAQYGYGLCSQYAYQVGVQYQLVQQEYYLLLLLLARVCAYERTVYPYYQRVCIRVVLFFYITTRVPSIQSSIIF